MSNKINSQVQAYLDFCSDVQGLMPKTVRERGWVYARFFDFAGIKNLNQIENDHLNQWIAHLAKSDVRNRSINTYVKYITTLIKWGRDSGIPAPKFKMHLVTMRRVDPPRRAWYNRAEINRVLSFANRKEWLMIALCYECGLRIAELRSLKVSDIRDNQISFIGKGRKQGYVYISKQIMLRLNDYIEAQRITEYLWPGKVEGMPLSVAQIRKEMARPFHAAGHHDFFPHALRHSCATELSSSGVPMEVVQQILRHSNVKVTQLYVHSFDGGSRELFEKYRAALTDADENLR